MAVAAIALGLTLFCISVGAALGGETRFLRWAMPAGLKPGLAVSVPSDAIATRPRPTPRAPASLTPMR
jgi:hypothetical protein